MAKLAQHLIDWLRAEIGTSGGTGAVFGLSGGIDSAVVAGLVTRALPGRALGVIMPCHSDPRDAEDAALVARLFGVPTATIDLGPVYDLLLEQLTACSPQMPKSRHVTTNLKPRLRMTALYAFANERGYRVIGTSNRSERTIGYFTKHGDGGADLLPLGALVKTQVRALAHELGVPARIIDKEPSAGLFTGQTDENEMGLTYQELDAYLLSGSASPAVKARVDALRADSKHKRSLARIAPKPSA